MCDLSARKCPSFEIGQDGTKCHTGRLTPAHTRLWPDQKFEVCENHLPGYRAATSMLDQGPLFVFETDGSEGSEGHV